MAVPGFSFLLIFSKNIWNIENRFPSGNIFGLSFRNNVITLGSNFFELHGLMAFIDIDADFYLIVGILIV